MEEMQWGGDVIMLTHPPPPPLHNYTSSLTLVHSGPPQCWLTSPAPSRQRHRGAWTVLGCIGTAISAAGSARQAPRGRGQVIPESRCPLSHASPPPQNGLCGSLCCLCRPQRALQRAPTAGAHAACLPRPSEAPEPPPVHLTGAPMTNCGYTQSGPCPLPPPPKGVKCLVLSTESHLEAPQDVQT